MRTRSIILSINIAVENNVNFSEEEMNAIVSLLQQIAQQSYDIEQMKNTLEEIQESMDKEDEVQATETPAPEEGEGTESGDDTEDVENTEDTEDTEGDGEDITETVDPSVLGDDVKQSSTEDPSLVDLPGTVSQGRVRRCGRSGWRSAARGQIAASCRGTAPAGPPRPPGRSAPNPGPPRCRTSTQRKGVHLLRRVGPAGVAVDFPHLRGGSPCFTKPSFIAPPPFAPAAWPGRSSTGRWRGPPHPAW